MQNVIVNKKDIQTIRDDLQLPLFELIQHMNALGWDATVHMPGEYDGSVYFSKRAEWHDRPLLSTKCSYGYRFESANWDSVNAAAQRAAELCLTLYEKFVRTIPGNPNIYGEIGPDIIINQPQFSNITYQEFLKKHEDKQMTICKSSPWAPESWYFSYYRFNVTVMPDEEHVLMTEIQWAKRVLSGEFALVD